MEAINSNAEGIKHKNYDIFSPKDDIDIFYTQDDFLNPVDRVKIKEINEQQADRGIPDNILNLYKVISKGDKIKVYDKICYLRLLNTIRLII
jgi:hypothetical protein